MKQLGQLLIQEVDAQIVLILIIGKIVLKQKSIHYHLVKL
jgi:hypothetical protein